MSLDQYHLCFCGSGKKFKFCCSHDILSELDKVLRSIQGNQRAAALEQVNHLIDTKGPRPALLVLKTNLLLALSDVATASTTVKMILEQSPANATARGLAAMVAASRGDIAEAIEKLQRALEACGEEMPMEVFEAIGAVGSLLLSRGDVIGGRAYHELQAEYQDDDDNRASQILAQLTGHPNLHPLLKQGFAMAECPNTVAWRDEFNRARQLADRNLWWRACEAFEDLAARLPGQPAIRRNLAILRSRLGNIALTASAWRAFAASPGVPLDDAAEAEALAMLLDSDHARIGLDVLVLTFTVDDVERLMERLLSDRSVGQLNFDPSDWDTEEGPPPKATFIIQDRPLPVAGAELTSADIPRIIGELMVFGKQTDRAARVELHVSRTHDLDAKRAAFRAAVGELASAQCEERVDGHVSAIDEPLRWNWRLPPEMPAKRRQELIHELRHDAMVEQWPRIPLALFDGKTPAQIAGDSVYRVKLMAALLLMEQVALQQLWKIDFNDVRRRLGVPTLDDIDPTSVDLSSLPFPRLHRLMADRLSDEHLLAALDLAMSYRYNAAIRRLALEAARRPSFEKQRPRVVALAALAQSSEDPAEMLGYFEQVRHAAEEAGMSPAPFMVQEMEIRMLTGDVATASELFERLRTRHLKEPGISQQLYTVLSRFGLITPDGRLAAPPGAAAGAVPAAAPPGKLWTPDSPSAPAPAAPAAAGEQKSKLWLPGMD